MPGDTCRADEKMNESNLCKTTNTPAFTPARLSIFKITRFVQTGDGKCLTGGKKGKYSWRELFILCILLKVMFIVNVISIKCHVDQLGSLLIYQILFLVYNKTKILPPC